MSARDSIMNYSDAALEEIVEFLARNKPDPPWLKEWWEDRLALVKQEIRRRLEEDMEGER